MTRIIEITTEDSEDIKEHAEKALEHIRKLIECVSDAGHGEGNEEEEEVDGDYL